MTYVYIFTCVRRSLRENFQCNALCTSAAYIVLANNVSSLSYCNNLPYLGTLRKSLNLAHRRQQNLKTKTTRDLVANDTTTEQRNTNRVETIYL